MSLKQTGDFVNVLQRQSRKKYRFKTRDEAEIAERKAVDEAWMFQAALEDSLSGWTGTQRGGDPVTFKGRFYTFVAMRPESASGGFILSIRHRADDTKRKATEVLTPATAKDWQHSLCRTYDSTAPDHAERQEIITLLAKAINALPNA